MATQGRRRQFRMHNGDVQQDFVCASVQQTRDRDTGGLEHSKLNNLGSCAWNNKSPPPWQASVFQCTRENNNWMDRVSLSVAWGRPSADEETQVNPSYCFSRYIDQWHGTQWRDAAAVEDGSYSTLNSNSETNLPPQKYRNKNKNGAQLLKYFGHQMVQIFQNTFQQHK